MSLKYENVQISPMSQGPRSSTTVAVLFLPRKPQTTAPGMASTPVLGRRREKRGWVERDFLPITVIFFYFWTVGFIRVSSNPSFTGRLTDRPLRV